MSICKPETGRKDNSSVEDSVSRWTYCWNVTDFRVLEANLADEETNHVGYCRPPRFPSMSGSRERREKNKIVRDKCELIAGNA